MRSCPFYVTVLYIVLYIQPADGFQELKRVAVNYLKWWLIKVVLDSIYYYYIYYIVTQQDCLA
jgi:hypothetical protein